jgi:hypothetical protein
LVSLRQQAVGFSAAAAFGFPAWTCLRKSSSVSSAFDFDLAACCAAKPSPVAASPSASTIASIAFALVADIARSAPSAKAAAGEVMAPAVELSAKTTAALLVA